MKIWFHRDVATLRLYICFNFAIVLAMNFSAGDIVELEITDLAFGGDGVARHEGMVFFVNGGITGQVVKAEVKRVKRRFV